MCCVSVVVVSSFIHLFTVSFPLDMMFDVGLGHGRRRRRLSRAEEETSAERRVPRWDSSVSEVSFLESFPRLGVQSPRKTVILGTTWSWLPPSTGLAVNAGNSL